MEYIENIKVWDAIESTVVQNEVSVYSFSALIQFLYQIKYGYVFLSSYVY